MSTEGLRFGIPIKLLGKDGAGAGSANPKDASEQIQYTVMPEVHLAAVIHEALRLAEDDKTSFHHTSKVSVARAIEEMIKEGDKRFLPRKPSTLVGHIRESGYILRNFLEEDLMTSEPREASLEGLTLKKLLEAEEFKTFDSWRRTLRELSETLPESTTGGQVVALLIYYAEAYTEGGDSVSARLDYARKQESRLFS